MHRYLKKAVCYLAILICVPYFVTVFLNGSGRGGSVEVDETYVRVESSESGDGSGNGADIADGDGLDGSAKSRGLENRDSSGDRDVDDDGVDKKNAETGGDSGSKEKNGNDNNSNESMNGNGAEGESEKGADSGDSGSKERNGNDSNSRDSRKIIEMPLEDYGISVMAKEMPGSYKKEAWKAQAVLVRTSICEKMNQDGSDTVLEQNYLTDAQKKQLWGNNKYYSYYNKLKKAWEETDGEILTWKGKPAYAPFCRLTNGSTRDAKESLGEEYPYLKKVTCPKDLENEWQIQTTMVKDLDAKVTALDSAGYVKKVRIGKEIMSGEAFREKYHLASSSFILQKYDGKLRIITCGVGHGYGMSQYTANEMAKKGKTYKEILGYFYKKTKIREVAEIVQGE